MSMQSNQAVMFDNEGPSGSVPASQPGSAAKMSPSATAAAGAAAAGRAASAPGQTVVPRAPATTPAPAAAAASSAAPPAAGVSVGQRRPSTSWRNPVLCVHRLLVDL